MLRSIVWFRVLRIDIRAFRENDSVAVHDSPRAATKSHLTGLSLKLETIGRVTRFINILRRARDFICAQTVHITMLIMGYALPCADT